MKEIMAIIDRMEAFAASSDDGYAINGWADELRTLLAALLSSDRAVQPEEVPQLRVVPLLSVQRLEWVYPYGSEEPYVRIADLDKISRPASSSAAQPEIADTICPFCGDPISVLKPSGGCLTADINGYVCHPICADRAVKEPAEGLISSPAKGQRVHELAKEGAFALHLAYCDGGANARLPHAHPFDTCEHPDCKLVRAARDSQ